MDVLRRNQQVSDGEHDGASGLKGTTTRRHAHQHAALAVIPVPTSLNDLLLFPFLMIGQ